MIQYKVLAWFQLICGTLAVLGSLNPVDLTGFLGGAIFALSGIAILDLLNKVPKF